MVVSRVIDLILQKSSDVLSSGMVGGTSVEHVCR